MQTVILRITDKDEHDEVKWFDTIKQAQDAAVAYKDCQFGIFTMHLEGKRPIEIEWKPATDHATNMRVNTKNAKARKKSGRAGAWSQLEVDTAIRARAAGKTLHVIAAKLGRSYNSVYMKLQKEKKKAK
jgi:hypothetical protein